MILPKILYHDLHRSRKPETVALHVHVPVPPDWEKNVGPAIVSSTRGKFLVARRLQKNGLLMSGVFEYDPDEIDSVIPDLFSTAFSLSSNETLGNIFETPSKCFDFISDQAGSDSYPHVCVIPSSWSMSKTKKVFGKDFDVASDRYKKCRIERSQINVPVFLSRPDFVGMYTQITGGMSSIAIHNVRFGMSFLKVLP